MDLFILQNCPTIVDDLERVINSGVSIIDIEMDAGYQIFGACSDDYLQKYWNDHEDEFLAALDFIWKWYANESDFHFENNVQRMIFVYEVFASDFEE